MKKAVLITGAGSGIGEASAKLFSQHGYFVFLLGRSGPKLEKVAETLKFGAMILKCDLADESAISKAVDNIFQQPHANLEVLVNNAGIFEQHNFTDGGIEVWRRQFETNLFGPVSLTQKIFPYFQKQRKGSIVNVSSGLGLRATANTSAYGASKAAMISWTRSMALEGGAFNIRANCVCPGLVDTPIHPFHSQIPAEKEATLKSMASLQPLGRLGTSEEIATAIYFLACEESAWTTGAILSVDGGINL